MDLFENLQIMKENSESEYNDLGYDERTGKPFGVHYDPDKPEFEDDDELENIKENVDNEEPVFEAYYKFNGSTFEVILTEEEEFINVYINDNIYLQEPKNIINDDHDLEYLAFSSVVDYYKELKFADKLEEAAIIKDEKDIEQVVENTTLRPFDTRDYVGWGGAHKFSDGSAPMIVDGEYATIIVSQSDEQVGTDEATIAIYYGDVDADENHWSFKGYDDKESAIKDAKILAKLVDDEIDESQLDRFGFTNVC